MVKSHLVNLLNVNIVTSVNNLNICQHSQLVTFSTIELEEPLRGIVPLRHLILVDILHVPALRLAVLVALRHKQFPRVGVRVQAPGVAAVLQPRVLGVVPIVTQMKCNLSGCQEIFCTSYSESTQ